MSSPGLLVLTCSPDHEGYVKFSCMGHGAEVLKRVFKVVIFLRGESERSWLEF